MLYEKNHQNYSLYGFILLCVEIKPKFIDIASTKNQLDQLHPFNLLAFPQ